MAGRLGGRRPRPCRDRRRARMGAATGPPEPHRLQDDHRLWRADQGRHRRRARQPARRRGDQGRTRAARLGLSALRHPRGCKAVVAWGRCARRQDAPGLGNPPRRARRWQASGIPASPERQAAARSRQDGRRHLRGFPRQERQAGDPPGLGRGARRAGAGGARTARRLGRPDPVEQHQGQGRGRGQARRFLRPLHALGRARDGHGRGDERHRRAWRAHSLWRHLSHLHRLRQGCDPPVGADGGRRHLCDDARFDRARRGRADASAGRASRGAARDAAPQRVPPGRRGRDRRVLGIGAWKTATRRRSWRSPASRCRCSAPRSTARTCRRRAPTSSPRPMASGR